ncbi:CDP-glycerol glycerophosphotransferase family protein [Stutzerimonas sp. VN223-3]|uniref:CDP-glycerol glycerophosphotransferase family protein n=1 Tax=Stutzerimonas sp. VN223-3 TaxID=3384601 RepID=UPI0038B4BE04
MLDRWSQAQIASVWFGKYLALPFFWMMDRLLPKQDDHWAFFAHPLKRTQFVENSRAVFEEVKADPRICKRIFTRGPGVTIELEGACNTEVVNLQSLGGLLALTRCGVLLLTNSITMDLALRWSDGSRSFPRPSLTRRLVVNLWHGIPLKRLFALANPEQRNQGDRVPYRRRERAFYRGLVASSDVDSYAMTAIFHPIPYENVWVTGLPRNDFLKRAEAHLPAFLRRDLELIRSLKGGRRLVVYAPTYRETAIESASYYQFSEQEITALREVLERHDAVLGFRMHYFRNVEALFNMERFVDGHTLIDLGHEQIAEIAPILREADVVVTDYSSVYIDALYLDKPVMSFAYDLEHYRSRQNGLLYDMDLAFPGPVSTRFEAWLNALDELLSCPQQHLTEHYRKTQTFFFAHGDDCNSRRVIDRIAALTRYER